MPHQIHIGGRVRRNIELDCIVHKYVYTNDNLLFATETLRKIDTHSRKASVSKRCPTFENGHYSKQKEFTSTRGANSFLLD